MRRFSHKLILPIILIKIALAMLVLQLFFSSCSDDELLSTSSIFSEGPVFEIEATLTSDTEVFDYETTNVISSGDTLFLSITIEDNTLLDQISGTDYTLSDPEFNTQFAIVDAEGNNYFPEVVLKSGNLGNTTTELCNASFNYNKDLSLNLGFVFNKTGDYTFYFINTPSAFIESGTVDIYYDNKKSKAYAVYLFDFNERSVDYGSSDNDANYMQNILYKAGSDQAIMDFTVIEEN